MPKQHVRESVARNDVTGNVPGASVQSGGGGTAAQMFDYFLSVFQSVRLHLGHTLGSCGLRINQECPHRLHVNVGICSFISVATPFALARCYVPKVLVRLSLGSLVDGVLPVPLVSANQVNPIAVRIFVFLFNQVALFHLISLQILYTHTYKYIIPVKSRSPKTCVLGQEILILLRNVRPKYFSGMNSAFESFRVGTQRNGAFKRGIEQPGLLVVVYESEF